MPQNAPAKDRRRRSRRSTSVELEGQYSLFAAAIFPEARDAHYFHRQAALCERLLSSVHQPELCARLASLKAEFEAAALAGADAD